MLVYGGVIFVLYFLSFSKIRHKKLAYWVCVSVLALISGIRYDVGVDWQMYVDEYAKMYNGDVSRDFEIGYRLLEKAFCKMGFSTAYMMIFCISVFVTFSFARAIEKNVEEKYWFFSLALFVTTITYFSTMNAMRQFLAIAILLFGLEKLKAEKYWQFIIITLIAASIQTVILAVFLLFGLMYVCKHFRLDLFKILQILFIVSLTGLFIDYTSMALVIIRHLLPAANRFQLYISETSGLYYQFVVQRNDSAILKTIFPNLMWICAYMRRDKINLTESIKNIYFTAFLIFLLFNNCFYGINIFIRLGYVFDYYVLFLFPAYIDSFSDSKKRCFGKACILGYYLLLTAYGIFYKGGEGVLPYQTLL